MSYGDPPHGAVFNDFAGYVSDECRCPNCTRPDECEPATCCNGKCRATGACVDRPALASGGYVAPRPLPLFGEALHPLQAITDAPPLVPMGLEFGDHPNLPAPRTVVGFAGLAGSGKTTAAMHLVSAHGFARVRFAGPLKAMCAALGLTPDEIDGALKEAPCELLGGRTPRYAMQRLGTEFGRDLIDPNLWVRAWRAAVDRLPIGQPVVVDDCRFPNEAEAIQAAGGVLVRVVRPGAGAAAAGHSSEGQVLPHALAIRNDDGISELLFRVDALVRDLSWAMAARAD